MDAEIAVAYEQRVYLTKRQVRCCVGLRWSAWHDLTVEEARILDGQPAAAPLDFRIARACWPGPHVLEGCTA